ncbi:transporter [Cupriavidus basilensis]|uniref:transporter n=1 Tax=Cupriavidus basilensis TaxID=68895 RepID=UPI00284735B2|nr:transporter [Cupriavidus basilensis]MDR3380458.1 transporter [Cupriavidus basilensis]
MKTELALMGTLAGTLISAGAWAQVSAQPSADERIERLTQLVEQQDKTIKALEQRLNDLEMVGARGRGVVAGTGSSANGNAGGGMTAAGVPSLAQSASPAASGTATATPAGDTPVVGSDARETQQQARVQSKDLVYQSEHAPLFERRLTIDSGFIYSYYDRRALSLSGFLALDAIFLGTINLNQTKSHTLTYDTIARYGLSDRLSMDFDLPVMYRNTNFISGGAGGSASSLSDATLSTTALGDISMGLYYQFLRESGAAPDVVGSIRVRAPTGRTPFGIKLVSADPNNNNLNIADQLPTGNGVWAVTAGLSLLKTYDPVVLFVNASYTYNIKRSVSDISSVQGQVTPADVKLGDTIGFGGGLALALNDRTSMSMAFNAAISSSTQVTTAGITQTVIGSRANVATMTFGFNHVITKGLSVSTAIGIGLTPDAPNYTVTLRFPYTF